MVKANDLLVQPITTKEIQEAVVAGKIKARDGRFLELFFSPTSPVQGNKAGSAKAAGFKGKSSPALTITGTRVLNKTNVAELWQEAFSTAGIDSTLISDKLKTGINSVNENTVLKYIKEVTELAGLRAPKKTENKTLVVNVETDAQGLLGLM